MPYAFAPQCYPAFHLSIAGNFDPLFAMSALDFLNSRLSVPSRQLGEPAPSAEQIEQLLAAAIRTPDHGKLMPTRLLLIRGQTRAKLGEALAAIHRKIDPAASESVWAVSSFRADLAWGTITSPSCCAATRLLPCCWD